MVDSPDDSLSPTDSPPGTRNSSKARNSSKRRSSVQGQGSPGGRRRSSLKGDDVSPTGSRKSRRSSRASLKDDKRGFGAAFGSSASSGSEEEEPWYRRLKCPTPTPVQVVICILAAIVLGWILVISVFLGYLSGRYKNELVDMTRDRYVLSASQRVGAKVVKVLEAAHGARQAVDYAVQRQLYFDPLDYDALRMALEPAFAAFVPLRAVDVAFDAQNDSLAIRRQIGTGAKKDLLVQSDAHDCFEKLGRYGCLSAPPARGMPWYQLGLELPGGMEADNHSDILTSRIMDFRWADGPGFVPDAIADIVGNGTAVAWAPAQSLIFRSVFPGTSGQLSLIGRAVVQVTGFSADDALLDTKHVGQKGAVYVTDALGTLLATFLPGQQALVLPTVGVTRFRMIWELGGWASHLDEKHFKDAPQSQSFKADVMQVAITKFTGTGNGHFFIVVVGERLPFVDQAMEMICEVSSMVVWSPYPSCSVVLLITLLIRYLNHRRRLRRVAALADRPHSPSSPLSPVELMLADKPTDKSMELLRERTNQLKDASRASIGDKSQLALPNR
mmetsp:Transcript_16289/g.28477  ORF Transcript_16289/g.28477 Transcript_16289/m.28477 type:complete len:557 (+) Transcript_16289:85-1755(+)